MKRDEIKTAKQKEYRRRYYEKCKSEGRCCICGKPCSPKKGGGMYTHCDSCRETERARYYNARLNNFCVVCGVKLPQKYTFYNCVSCRKKALVYYYRRKQQAKT